LAGRLTKWLRTRHHARRAISHRRRWIGIAALVFLLSAGGAYKILTDESRLRRFAENWLEHFSGGQAQIKEVRFDLCRGLHLVGVRIDLPESADFVRDKASAAARPIFRSSTLYLRLQPLSVITGDLVVPEVVAVDPEINLVRRLPTGVGNWEIMLRHWEKRRKRQGPMSLPVIRLRNVRLHEYLLADKGGISGGTQTIWVDAQPEGGHLYDVDITKYLSENDTQSDAVVQKGESGRLKIDMNALAVSGSLPSMSIDELLFTASPEIHHWLEVLALRGRIRVDHFEFEPERRAKAFLSLHDVSMSLPIDAQERKDPERSRFVKMKGISGKISFAGRGAEVDLAGRFRDCPMRVKGRMTLPEGKWGGLETVGFDLRVTMENVLLPRHGRQAGQEEVRFIQSWERLSEFLHHYDATGPVDMFALLHKSPGSDESIRLVEGDMTGKGNSVCYFRFPYQAKEARGTVRFRRDGGLTIKDIRATHGQGRLSLSGEVAGWGKHYAAALDIEGRNIRLDQNLLECLSPRDRRLCKMFNARACMDVDVHLERKQVSPEVEKNPWQATVDVRFKDGSVKFEKFPYPLENLRGRISISGGEFRIERLQAGRGKAKVALSGIASRGKDGRADVDLDLEAASVPLDEMLAEALPEESKALYQRFAPAGRFDLKGRVFTGNQNGKTKYDLHVSFSDVSWRWPESSAKLTDSKGRVHIASNKLAVESLETTFGESKLHLSGQYELATSATVDLHLQSDELKLDDALQQALPETLGKLWQMFQPTGSIGLDVKCCQRKQPATRPAEGDYTYKAVIKPKDCTAVLSRFPLPLKKINGHLVVTPGQVDIKHVKATAGKAKFELAGCVEKQSSQMRAKLKLDAQNIRFTEAFRNAVPWRIRRMWNDVQPKGKVDFKIDELILAVQDGETKQLSMVGSADMHDLELDLGAKLSNMRGDFTGRVELADPLSVNGQLSFKQLRVDELLLTGASATIERSRNSSVLSVQDIMGELYGGKIIGRAEVDFAPKLPKYGLSLTGRDISLQKLLNAKRDADKPPVELKGQVEGNLALAGQFNDPRSRHGGGSVFISQAQMFKVPLLLTLLQVIHFSIDDNNAFQDATFRFAVDEQDVILEEIDLRGRAFSMIGAGRIHLPKLGLNLTLLLGSPLDLPRVEVLSEFVEGVARELVEVRVEGSLEKPEFRADIVRSLKKTLNTILNARRSRVSSQK